MELSFISDTSLRQRIESSIEYIYALYEESKRDEKNKLYQTETYRVIILYTVQIIEAVLFYVYEKKGDCITRTEYKEIKYLSNEYKNERCEGRVCVAVEKTTKKSESEIGLRELAQFLVNKRVLKKETAGTLQEILHIRNSVHLRQKTNHACTVADVEKALDFLVYILTYAPKSVSGKSSG